MQQIKTFSDSRLDECCSYCGDFSDTRDHVPSKILLDDPFPENLPIVPCCFKCNQGFSLDEEYFACLLECILCGSTDIANLNREKIKTILSKKESLQKLLNAAMINENGKISFKIQEERIKNVIIKLAKGHVKFENSDSQFEDPAYINITLIESMSDIEIETFLSANSIEKASEIGSRFFQRLYVDKDNSSSSNWIVIQPDKYSYSVSISLEITSVKIMIWNYLAIEAGWK